MGFAGKDADEAMTVREAAAWIAQHTKSREPATSTLHRWIVSGVKGARLQAARVGSRYWTTPAHIAEFLDRLNRQEVPAQHEPPGGSSGFQRTVRHEQVEAACKALEDLCGSKRVPK